MKAVSEGQLYFLKSPFTSTVDVKHEKTLAYILGTVSSRPAVVIRAPAFWDNYNTVTVIPCLSEGHPSIPLNLSDRYGYLTESSYKFIPHNPHTIPVGRLGRFIGTLDDIELEEIMYAFEWIHDKHFREEHPSIPNCYKDVMNQNQPRSWHYNKDSRAEVDLTIDGNMKVSSTTHPMVDGVVLDVDFPSSVSPHVIEEIEKDPDYHGTTQALPDLGEINHSNMVPIERGFPESMFDEKELNRVASRFNIEEPYYKNTVKKHEYNVLTEDETRMIKFDLSREQYNTILDIYTRMKPVDAMLFGPRLPTPVLCRLLNISSPIAAGLKRLCNYLRDINDSDYQNRLMNINKTINDAPVINNSTSVTKHISTTFMTDVEFNKQFPLEVVKSRQTEMVEKLRPFLNSKMIFNVPKQMIEDFVRLPEYLVRQAYTGKSFKTNYDKAFTEYRGELVKEYREKVM